MNTTPESPTAQSQVNLGLLLAGLIVGASVGLGIALQLDPVVKMPDDLGPWPISPTPEYVARYNKAYSTMWMGNLAISFAVIGVASGAAAALLFARVTSAAKSVLIPVLGLLGGGIGGLVTGLMLASAHSTQGRLDVFGFALDPMLQSVLFQTIVWSGIGIGIGAGLALGHRQPISRGIGGGLLGGFAAAVLHALIGSIAFPSSDMANLLPPNTIERYIWVVYSAACLAVGLWWTLRRK